MPLTEDEKLEKVLYLNGRDISRVHKKFTGKVLIHWKDGDPRVEEETPIKEIKLGK